MSTLERAIAIAAEAHAGQTDKAGEPYILHPLRVMLSVKPVEDKIVAVLHDVVEDCPDWPLVRLAGEGFAPAILNALEALTRRERESYDAFIARAGRDEIARRVKLADLCDNMEEGRLDRLPGTDRARLLRKYERATDALSFG